MQQAKRSTNYGCSVLIVCPRVFCLILFAVQKENSMMISPVRQSPAEVLPGPTPDPTRPDVRTGKPQPEPILRVENIQGNILGGFSKDHQMNIYFAITD